MGIFFHPNPFIFIATTIISKNIEKMDSMILIIESYILIWKMKIDDDKSMN